MREHYFILYLPDSYLSKQSLIEIEKLELILSQILMFFFFYKFNRFDLVSHENQLNILIKKF